MFLSKVNEHDNVLEVDRVHEGKQHKPLGTFVCLAQQLLEVLIHIQAAQFQMNHEEHQFYLFQLQFLKKGYYF